MFSLLAILFFLMAIVVAAVQQSFAGLHRVAAARWLSRHALMLWVVFVLFILILSVRVAQGDRGAALGMLSLFWLRDGLPIVLRGNGWFVRRGASS